LTIVVTNEVGLGIVPTDNALSRAYRDLLGRVNAIWADAADRAYLLIAGRALALAKTDPLSELLP
jgi:adenosylcobyric acid synthase